ncbi:hypothetical protein [Natronomonas gomsonensis]|uniref:hypothetical protein n=1 Tax=Natronomonas gomsonensis TaxID=1046043 RepID=UPI0015BDCE68|nr:hypothetical protein [Natronomonas gomsonensis]
MLPTIQGSGATSSPSAEPVAAAGSDEWLPTETTEGPTAEQPTGSAGTGPRIVLETSEGHSFALDGDDLMLAVMFVLLAIEVRRAA